MQGLRWVLFGDRPVRASQSRLESESPLTLSPDRSRGELLAQADTSGVVVPGASGNARGSSPVSRVPSSDGGGVPVSVTASGVASTVGYHDVARMPGATVRSPASSVATTRGGSETRSGRSQSGNWRTFRQRPPTQRQRPIRHRRSPAGPGQWPPAAACRSEVHGERSRDRDETAGELCPSHNEVHGEINVEIDLFADQVGELLWVLPTQGRYRQWLAALLKAGPG